MKKSEAGQKEIMIMSIDLGSKIDFLHVREGDEPYDLAETFC